MYAGVSEKQKICVTSEKSGIAQESLVIGIEIQPGSNLWGVTPK